MSGRARTVPFNKKKYQKEDQNALKQRRKATPPVPPILQERCEACACGAGDGYIHSSLIEYREHKLCHHCISAWKRREKLEGKTVTWGQFLKGKELV